MIIRDSYFLAYKLKSESGLSRWRYCLTICQAVIYINKTEEIVADELHNNLYNHLPSPKKNINRQILNNACKRKAIDDLFSRSKKVILKEFEQSSADCSNFDDTDQRLTILLFYFLEENGQELFFFYFFPVEISDPVRSFVCQFPARPSIPCPIRYIIYIFLTNFR
jgi:hypothetical protein